MQLQWQKHCAKFLQDLACHEKCFLTREVTSYGESDGDFTYQAYQDLTIPSSNQRDDRKVSCHLEGHGEEDKCGESTVGHVSTLCQLCIPGQYSLLYHFSCFLGEM